MFEVSKYWDPEMHWVCGENGWNHKHLSEWNQWQKPPLGLQEPAFCIKHVFYFLYSDALTAGALWILEGLPYPELVNS